MKYNFDFAKRLLKDDKGATAIEYGLLAALIAVVIIAAVSTLGGTLRDTFNDVNGYIGNPATAPTGDDAEGGEG